MKTERTLRELTIISLKELGCADEQIKQAMEYADFHNPNEVAGRRVELQPGATERHIIDALKEAYKMLMALTPEQKALHLEAMCKIKQRVAGTN